MNNNKNENINKEESEAVQVEEVKEEIKEDKVIEMKNKSLGMVRNFLRNDMLPNITIFKDRTDAKETYCYISKHSGILKKTDMTGLISKVSEELFEFDWYRDNFVPVCVSGKSGYNLISETIKVVDDIIFSPVLPFGVVTSKEDKAFKVFNYCKQSPVKTRLLAEIKRIKNKSFDFGDDLIINEDADEFFGVEVQRTNIKLAETVSDLFIKLKEQYTHSYLMIWNCVGGNSITAQESEKRIKYLLNWMARATRPEEGKCNTAIVFRGNQGTGKTALAETFFQYLFKNYIIFDNSKLESQFNEGVDRAEFVFCEEVEISDKNSGKTYSKLKEYITNKTTDMNVKQISARNVRIWFNMMFAQNPGPSMKFEHGDRRYTVFVTGEDKLLDLANKQFGYEDMDTEFFGRIRDFERDDFLMDLLNLTYNKSQTEKVLVTKEKLELTEQTNTSEMVIGDAVKNREFIKLFEEGYINTIDMLLAEDKMKVVKFYIEASNGYLSQDSRRIFTYFSLLHKKGVKKVVNIEQITEKEINDTVNKPFTQSEKIRPTINGSRQRITVLNKNSYDKENLKKAQAILEDKDDMYREFFRLTNQDYSDMEEYSQLIADNC